MCKLNKTISAAWLLQRNQLCKIYYISKAGRKEKVNDFFFFLAVGLLFALISRSMPKNATNSLISIRKKNQWGLSHCRVLCRKKIRTCLKNNTHPSLEKKRRKTNPKQSPADLYNPLRRAKMELQ